MFMDHGAFRRISDLDYSICAEHTPIFVLRPVFAKSVVTVSVEIQMQSHHTAKSTGRERHLSITVTSAANDDNLVNAGFAWGG